VGKDFECDSLQGALVVCVYLVKQKHLARRTGTTPAYKALLGDASQRIVTTALKIGKRSAFTAQIPNPEGRIQPLQQ